MTYEMLKKCDSSLSCVPISASDSHRTDSGSCRGGGWYANADGGGVLGVVNYSEPMKDTLFSFIERVQHDSTGGRELDPRDAAFLANAFLSQQ